MFPEFYVADPDMSDDDEMTAVYYKVTGRDPGGHVFWRREGMDRSKETTFYDLFMEERNGFTLEPVEQEETPWADG